jgi:Xaa-Pro aminopeptidase
MESRDKLSLLRKSIEKHKLNVFLQPVQDEYMNEYPPASARRVEWLSGFAGSAGTVVVTLDKAALFVDGRYTLQAKNQVDGTLFEQHNISDLSPEKWLAQHLASGLRVGYDAKLHTRSAVKRMQAVLTKKDITLVAVENLVDEIWKDRPAAPASQLFIHEEKYSGESSSSKRERIAKSISEAGADVSIVSAPDALCWLLNVRAHDVESSPLALATVIIDTNSQVQLFIASSRCDASVRAHLGNEVSLNEPASLERALQDLGKEKQHVLIDASGTSALFSQVLENSGAEIV